MDLYGKCESHKNQRNTYNIDAIEQIFTRVSLYLRHTILWQREFTVNVHSLMENVLIKFLLELIISLNIGYEKNFWIRKDKVENTLEPSLVWSSRKAIHFHYPTHDIVSILLAGNESRCLPRVPPSWAERELFELRKRGIEHILFLFDKFSYERVSIKFVVRNEKAEQALETSHPVVLYSSRLTNSSSFSQFLGRKLSLVFVSWASLWDLCILFLAKERGKR